MFLEEYSDLNNCNIIKDLSAWFLVSAFDYRQLTKVSDQNIVRTFRVHGLSFFFHSGPKWPSRHFRPGTPVPRPLMTSLGAWRSGPDLRMTFLFRQKAVHHYQISIQWELFLSSLVKILQNWNNAQNGQTASSDLFKTVWKKIITKDPVLTPYSNTNLSGKP